MPENSWGVVLKNIEFSRGDPARASFGLSIDRLELNFSGARGARIPIMGRSGAGKSTLLNLLAGVVWPDNPEASIEWTLPKGRFKWSSKGPRPEDLIALRRRYFGYAFQSSTLQPQLTIGENLALCVNLTGVPWREAEERALDLLSDVFHGDRREASQFLDRFEDQVSGGEKQRISLAQALVHDPCVLFADEPTGNLDVDTRELVMSVLKDWLKDPSHTLLWVTHHEGDPEQNDAFSRLYVSDGSCVWQDWNGEDWVSADRGALE